jgi:hypothetical protein
MADVLAEVVVGGHGWGYMLGVAELGYSVGEVKIIDGRRSPSCESVMMAKPPPWPTST